MTDPYRIRPAQTWVQAREDYLAGASAETVCRRHDLGLSAFRRRARKYGWRRRDQEAGPPDVADLSLYDDIDDMDQASTARLRFIQALNEGRAVEARRWRKLWQELQAEVDAINLRLFPGQTRFEVERLMDSETREDESDEELILLGPPAA